MISATWANETIAPADRGHKLVKRKFNTQDIMDLVLEAVSKNNISQDTREFSKAISPDREGMRKIYDFLLNEIRYKTDPRGSQWVKSPARLWSDREGDCKSYTVFTVSVLQNLGLDYMIRFVSFGWMSKRITHVYPIAILPNGEQIIIDAVWGEEGRKDGSREDRFNSEKSYTYKIDYHMENGLAYLTGTQQEEDILDRILAIDQAIPDDILPAGGYDVTQLTEGQLLRIQEAEKIEAAARYESPRRAEDLKFAAKVLKVGQYAEITGIGETQTRSAVLNFLRETEGMNQPAVSFPTLNFKLSNIHIDAISGLKIGKFFKKVGKGLGNAVKAVGGVIKKGGEAVWNGVKGAAKGIAAGFKFVVQKLLNFIFKIGLPGAGPFFLFQFHKKKGNAEVERRKAQQKKVLDWMENTAGMKRSNMEKAMRKGIVKKLGAEPERILNDYAGRPAPPPVYSDPVTGEKLSTPGPSNFRFNRLDIPGIGSQEEEDQEKKGGVVGAVAGIVTAILTAIKFVIDIVKKIGSLFKKDDNPSVQEGDASDVTLLENEWQVTDEHTRQGTGGEYASPGYKPYSPQQQPAGGGLGPLIPLGLAAFLVFS